MKVESVNNNDRAGNTSAKEVLLNWSGFDIKIILEGALIGAIAGLIVVAFRLILQWADDYRTQMISIAPRNITTVLVIFIVYLGMGLFLGRLVEKEPNIKGSGIPQIKGFILRQVRLNWLGELILKFIGGVIALGMGLSAGREGPSVQLGATVGLGFSRLFSRFHVEEKYLVTAGASAGLAAAFNAPLAGVLFALEELHKNVSPVMLTCILSAAVTGDFVAGNVFGLDPVLQLNDMPDLPFSYYGLIVLLGIVVAILGKLFNQMLLKGMDTVNSLPIKDRYVQIIPMLMAAVLFFVWPEMLGGGHHVILELAKGEYAIKAVLGIFTIKLLFTVITYSSKVPGGIFLPLLLLGALAGLAIGDLGVNGFGLDESYMLNFIALGMVGFFTAVVKAPLTGSVLISEMTGSFDHLLPIILVALISQITTDLIQSKPVYDALLEKMIEGNHNKKHNNYLKEDSERKSLIEIPVIYGSEIEHERIADICWPKNCLMISIKRGERELIPKGSYKLYAGDHLVFLTEFRDDVKLTEKLNAMAGEISVIKHRSRVVNN